MIYTDAEMAQTKSSKTHKLGDVETAVIILQTANARDPDQLRSHESEDRTIEPAKISIVDNQSPAIPIR